MEHTSAQSTLLLQCDSCPFTWSLTLIIIDKYGDVIFLNPAEPARKCAGKRERTVKQTAPESVTYSTHKDITSVEKRRCDVDMTGPRSKSLDDTPLQPRLTRE